MMASFATDPVVETDGDGSQGLVIRPERETDIPFRLALFCDSRPPGEDLAGFDAPLREMLLRQQFHGQDVTYRAQHPAARHAIVEEGGTPIGRFVTETAPEAVTLVDIALRPMARGRGIGTRLLRAIVVEAGDLPVRLFVAVGNATALRFYQRQGFYVVSRTDVGLNLEHRPALQPAGRHPAGTVPDRLRLPLVFDPVPLAAEVAGLASHDWIRHFVTANYDGDWDVIPLRAKAGAIHPVMMIVSDPAARDFVDTPFLAACPAIRAALARFHCPLDAVRLMRLGPGSTIKAHVDHDLSFEQGAVRFHVPIVTNPDVVFMLNGCRVTMEAGSAWYLRLSDPHGVDNHGRGDRVHLVIDARVNPWVTALFAEALATRGT